MEDEMLEKLDELKDTDACPMDNVNNLITWNECTVCGKHFNPNEHHGNPTRDGFLCEECYKKYEKDGK